MKPLEILKNGTIVDDLKCISYGYHVQRKTSVYLMRCTKCGRYKTMLPETVMRHSGTNHSACGTGLKTKNIKFHSIWCSLRTRTTNPTYEHYSDYGGRGINSDSWIYFIDFYDDMFESYKDACLLYGEKNVSLDRIDPDGNYEKSNCRWVHVKEQQGNTRRTVKFIIYFPDGSSKEYKNVNKTCFENGWNPSSLKSLLSGRMPTYKGLRGKRIN